MERPAALWMTLGRFSSPGSDPWLSELSFSRIDFFPVIFPFLSVGTFGLPVASVLSHSNNTYH